MRKQSIFHWQSNCMIYAEIGKDSWPSPWIPPYPQSRSYRFSMQHAMSADSPTCFIFTTNYYPVLLLFFELFVVHLNWQWALNTILLTRELKGDEPLCFMGLQFCHDAIGFVIFFFFAPRTQAFLPVWEIGVASFGLVNFHSFKFYPDGNPVLQPRVMQARKSILQLDPVTANQW